MNNKKLIAFMAGTLAALAAALCIIYAITRTAPIEGGKNITIEVVDQRDDYSFTDNACTSYEYLGDYLADDGRFTFENSDYGRYLTAVSGYEASNDDQSWWCIYVNGESAVTGVDGIVLEDGGVYRVELTIGW